MLKLAGQTGIKNILLNHAGICEVLREKVIYREYAICCVICRPRGTSQIQNVVSGGYAANGWSTPVML
jgi:hypothetical protein